MANKIFGYLLILVGLVIIFIGLYQSYKIFTGETTAPEIFKVPIVSSTENNNTQDIQEQIEQQIGKLLPADAVPKLLNLIIWSILAGILFIGGGQIAGIGVKLVSIKTEKPEQQL